MKEGDQVAIPADVRLEHLKGLLQKMALKQVRRNVREVFEFAVKYKRRSLAEVLDDAEIPEKQADDIDAAEKHALPQ